MYAPTVHVDFKIKKKKKNQWEGFKKRIDGLVQDSSNPIANALELLQFCTEPLI